MCSSAWSGGDSNEARDRAPHGPAVSDRPQPPGRRRPFLSADRRGEPRTLLDLLRGPAPVVGHRGLRVHLSVIRRPGAGGDDGPRKNCRDPGEHERPHRLRRPRRDDGRVLAQRPLVHGEPALLGEGDRKPAAVHDGADEPDGSARWHGGGRHGHDLNAGGLDAHRGDLCFWSHLPGGRPTHAPRRLLRRPDRAVWPWDDVRLPLPALGAGGMEPVRPHGGADLFLERILLPGRRTVQGPGVGPRRRDYRGVRARDVRARRAPATHPRHDRIRRASVDFRCEDGAIHPPLHGRPVLDSRQVLLGLPGDAREARGEVDLTASMNTFWRTFKVAAWLGWEMDSNWTEPWLFMVYSVVKPVAGAFILVLMYTVFAFLPGNRQDLSAFSYMYVGNSFFIFVGSVLFGTFQVIQSDREWYQTIRYVYMAPISYYVYIVGRAASKVVVAAFAVLITLVFGIIFLNVQIHMTLASVPLFLVSTALGLAVLLAIGICLGGVSFLTAKHTHGLAEGIPGLFYVFCGVLFPLSVLPVWGQAVGQAIPLTYWFDITRRLLAPTIGVDSTLVGYNDLTILFLLFVSSIAFFGLSVLIFKAGEYFARKAGKIDMTTSY